MQLPQTPSIYRAQFTARVFRIFFELWAFQKKKKKNPERTGQEPKVVVGLSHGYPQPRLAGSPTFFPWVNCEKSDCKVAKKSELTI